MSWTTPNFVRHISQYGNWTGPGWAAGRPSPPGDPLTNIDLTVLGIDAFDNNVSKMHDIAYDRAQLRLQMEFINGGFGKYAALETYFEAIKEADRAFIAAARNPANQAASPQGEHIRENAIGLFILKSAWEETRAYECRKQWGPNYADQIRYWTRPQILADLGWLPTAISSMIPNIDV